MKPIPHVTPAARNALAKAARRYRRQTGVPHRQALDVVARLEGFDHWRQVARGAARWERVRHRFNAGCVVAYDGAEIDGDDLAGTGFAADAMQSVLCDADLFRHHRESVDESDPAGRTFAETESEDVTREHHQADLEDLRFFSLDAGTQPMPTTVRDVLRVLASVTFWRPRHVWLRGRHHVVEADDDAPPVASR